jgi:DNA-binding MarR family transcriptional regulator
MNDLPIGHELFVLNNLIKRYFDYSSNKNKIESITGNNGCIIGFIGQCQDEKKDVFQKDIERHFGITKSTVSSVITLMEQKGLIQRVAVQKDARLKKIILTPKAESLKEIMRSDRDKLNQILTEGFSEDELNTLYNNIQRMKKNIFNH